MSPSVFLLKYASRRENHVSSAIERVISPVIKSAPGNQETQIEYKGECFQLEQWDSFFHSMARMVLSKGGDRFFDVSIENGHEVWSTLVLSGRLIAVIARHERHLSERQLDRDRMQRIGLEAASSGVIDVFFDPGKKCYQGRMGLLYLFLKAKGENPSFKREISSSTAEAGDLLIEFFEEFGDLTSAPLKGIDSFLINFENNLVSEQRNHLEGILKGIGIDPDSWWNVASRKYHR